MVFNFGLKMCMAVRAVFVIIVALFFVIIAFSSVKGGGMQVKVMQVKDGDTVVVSPVDGGQFFTCRLYGIDAPETARRNRLGQPFGEDAKKELKSLVLGQKVDVVLARRDAHNREVCIIRKNNININLEMVKRGYAWAFVRFARRHYASQYIEAEKHARDKRIGLWKDANPIPPWEFRKINNSQRGQQWQQETQNYQTLNGTHAGWHCDMLWAGRQLHQ
jgi:endonuclease YncB( thermonuclease family)